MTVRLAAVGDAAAIRTLIVAARPSLVADYGATTADYTQAQVLSQIQAGHIAVIVDASPMRGCCVWFHRHDGWELVIVFTDPALPALTRIASVKAMWRAALLAAPAGTMISGLVKTGGTMDQLILLTFTNPAITHVPDASSGMTLHSGTAADILAAL